MVGKLKELPSVDDVETYQSWTEKLARLVRGGVAAAALLARRRVRRRCSRSSARRCASCSSGGASRSRSSSSSARPTGSSASRSSSRAASRARSGAACAIALLAVLFLVVRGRLDEELAALVGVEPTFLPWQVAGGMVAARRRPRRDGGPREPAQAGRGMRRAALGAVAAAMARRPASRGVRLAAPMRGRAATRRSRWPRSIARSPTSTRPSSPTRSRSSAWGAGRRRARARAVARAGVLQADARGPAPGRRRLRRARQLRDARRAHAAAARAGPGRRDAAAHARRGPRRRLERIARDRVALAAQRTGHGRQRASRWSRESRRQAAFDRAFQTSTGAAADYVAVYGGGASRPTRRRAASPPRAGGSSFRSRVAPTCAPRTARARTDPASRSTRPPARRCAPCSRGTSPSPIATGRTAAS